MQLIQPTEPAPIHVKKTMSSLGEALEDNQINGVIADIVNDVCTKISSKNDKVSKPIEDENVEQNEDCTVKTNGYSQPDCISEIDQISPEDKPVNQSSENNGSQSNGNLVSESSCESSTCADSRDSDKNIDSDQLSISDAIVDVKNNKASENDKNVDLSVNINDSINETEEDVVSEIDKNVELAKEIGHSSEDILENIVTSDSIEVIEKDLVNSETKTSEVPRVEESTENADTHAAVSNETLLDIDSSDKLLTDVEQNMEQDNTISETAAEGPKENGDNITANDVIVEAEEKDSVKAEMEEDSVVSIEPIENIEKEMGTPKAVDGELPLDVMPIQDSINKTSENELVSTTDAEKQLVDNENNVSSCNIDMELDKSELEIKETHEKDENKVSSTESAPIIQKCISVRNISDMRPAPSVNETIDTNDANEVSSKQEVEIESKSMDVDEADVSIVIPEKDSLDPQKYEKNNKETSKIKTTEEKVKLEITQKDSDNDVMEIDDVDDVTYVDKTDSPKSVRDKRKEKNGTGNNNKYCVKPEKPDSVINIDNDDDDKSNDSANNKVKINETSEVISIEDNAKDTDIQSIEKSSDAENKTLEVVESNSEPKVEKSLTTSEKTDKKQLPVVCKLSNTMDILSDDEDETPIVKQEEKKSEKLKVVEDQSKCINIDDDDDIMFIEESNSPSLKTEEIKPEQESIKEETHSKENADSEKDLKESELQEICPSESIKEEDTLVTEQDEPSCQEDNEESPENKNQSPVPTVVKENKPIITKDFLISVTKNLADMTRNELEDFCILKLVESVVDKSNLNEIKNKMKTMAQTIEDLRKKALTLTKQNRDLQVVVKTVQEDQKKRNSTPMMPMKITRSVGMQVMLNPPEKVVPKKKQTGPPPLAPNKPALRNNQNTKTIKPPANIPVPRLVPASSPTIKSPVANTTVKTPSKTTPQRPEKRPHSKVSPASSVTVDLTDDEPPTKVNTKTQVPVRLVPPQNLMAPKTRPQFGQSNNSPRKVYIPISSTNQKVMPGTAVIRNFVPTPRGRPPAVVRMQAVRLQTSSSNRHPAPLPDAMKQYQPPAWKALPPAPDLKLSKVDNGIVISWKFEGYQPDSYEEVASFQLYAYQETPAPPSTALWKKIGDIKALPLPMACTLTQFMSGFKYYFAVRAIDVRSRIGPFSLPGSIMLISKN